MTPENANIIASNNMQLTRSVNYMFLVPLLINSATAIKSFLEFYIALFYKIVMWQCFLCLSSRLPFLSVQQANKVSVVNNSFRSVSLRRK